MTGPDYSPRRSADFPPVARPTPPLATFDLWRVTTRRVPSALVRQVVDRPHLRRAAGLRFAKPLGTGRGRTFTPRDADPHRWALFAVWDSDDDARAFARSAQPRAWARWAEEHWRVELRPLASRGRWSGRDPFLTLPPQAPTPPQDPTPPRAPTADAPVAVLTRARLAARHIARFWRAVPPVADDLARAAGLRLALGVGEAPIGLQGTFSLWDDADALRTFAYRQPAHLTAVELTASVGWYAEELFARFAVVDSTGTVDGRDPATTRAASRRPLPPVPHEGRRRPGPRPTTDS